MCLGRGGAGGGGGGGILFYSRGKHVDIGFKKVKNMRFSSYPKMKRKPNG